MVAFPLSVLALAAGVYLLVKVKREFLGGAFSIMAWLVILLALLSIGFSGYRALHKGVCGKKCGKGHCNIEKNVVLKDGSGCHGKKNYSGTCPHAHSKQDIKIHVEVDTTIENL